VLHGPRTSNFREIVRTHDAAGATRLVDNHSELVAKAVELLRDPEQRETMDGAALVWAG
jgi:3-deoxy-D-manno-octulosonic-acid transferase